MKRTVIEHVLSALFVTIVVSAAVMFYSARREALREEEIGAARPFLESSVTEFDSPFKKALFRDLLEVYYPGRQADNEKLYDAVVNQRVSTFGADPRRAQRKQSLTPGRFGSLLLMYGKFLLVYVIVMLLTYYGVQTLGVWRFVRQRRRTELEITGLAGSGPIKHARRVAAAAGEMCAYFVLFSPAYVIAYSIRTEFNTDTTLFMVILALLSNGLLVTYANKFYHFLVAESRKGYVRTARVKNLNNSYRQDTPDGIPLRAIFRPVKHFEEHVLEHIYRNAHYQYLATLKEQASFLITGLVIIEMALNIHGHLCYEMLRQLLYRNFDIVAVIALSIFYTVKITELATDTAIHRENIKYGNIQ